MKRDSVEDCICIEIYEPVISTKTNQIYSNSCFAECAGEEKSDLVPYTNETPEKETVDMMLILSISLPCIIILIMMYIYFSK